MVAVPNFSIFDFFFALCMDLRFCDVYQLGKPFNNEVIYMPRIARIVIPEVPHHLTHRGNNRETIFRSNADIEAYIAILKRYSQKYGFRILGYCLMKNHVHIIGIPMRKNSMAKLIGVGHMFFARQMNEKYGRIGHLWQGRYFSCALNDMHLFAALRYVEQNPVRSEIVNFAWEYEWSSASAHINGDDKKDIIDSNLWSMDKSEWKEILSQCNNDAEIGLIRTHTKTGRPLMV